MITMMNELLSLSPTRIRSLLEMTVLASTTIAIAGGWRLLKHHTESQRSELEGESPGKGASPHLKALSKAGLVFCHPIFQFVLFVTLVWANQVLFNAYISHFRHESVTFIGRDFGRSWFALDTYNTAVRFVAAHARDGKWLAFSVLRVQAFLELPLIVFAYLAIGWMLGARAHRALVNSWMLVLVSISYTIALSIAEILLVNRYTADDLGLRLCAALFVPVYATGLEKLRRRIVPSELQGDARTGGFPHLLLFVAGSGALVYILVAAYDIFLLYNLRHLGRYGLGLVTALTILLAVTIWLGRPNAIASSNTDAGDTSPYLAFFRGSLTGLVVMFFAPALPLRYMGLYVLQALSGPRTIAAIAAGAIVIGSFAYGIRCWSSTSLTRRSPLRSLMVLIVAIIASSVVGIFAWVETVRLIHGTIHIPEMVLMWGLSAGLGSSLIIFWATERIMLNLNEETAASE